MAIQLYLLYGTVSFLSGILIGKIWSITDSTHEINLNIRKEEPLDEENDIEEPVYPPTYLQTYKI